MPPNAPENPRLALSSGNRFGNWKCGGNDDRLLDPRAGNMMGPDEVTIRRSLIVPAPWRVREHPERHRTARGTLIRETLVELAVHHAPILETLRKIQRLDRLQAALTAYARAADAAAAGLGLEHRRDLRAHDGLPMPTRLDLGDVVALAQLKPDTLEDLAVAAAVIHVTLDLPLYATAVRASLERIPALRPTVAWLVPSLLRWLHVRCYEALYGPFSTADGERARVPLDWEELAVMRAPGPRRRLTDRPPQEPYTLAYQVKAWWAVRVNGETARETARRWHARVMDKPHRDKHGRDADVADCGCFKVVRDGVKEVSRLLTSPE
jgi:hypothetical protein